MASPETSRGVPRKKTKRVQEEKEKKEKDAKRQAMLGEKKIAMKQTIIKLNEKLLLIEPKVKDAAGHAEVLNIESMAVKANGLNEKIATADESLDSAKKGLDDIKDGILALQKELTEDAPELMEVIRPDINQLSNKLQLHTLRTDKALEVAGMGKKLAKQKVFLAYETARMEVAAKLRVLVEAKEHNATDLFDLISGDGSGKLTKPEIKAWLAENKVEIAEEKLDNLFPGTPDLKNAEDHPEPVLLSEFEEEAEKEEVNPKDPVRKPVPKGEPKEKREGPLISRADFNRVIRIFYKVVKEIVLSDNLHIEHSGQIRRLDVGEVMEVFQGPVLDASVGVYRIKGKALRDGVSGWVTVAGNQGITFLLPGGNVFKVTIATPLTKDREVLEGTEIVRQLKSAEILEVLEWARTKGVSPVTRIKVKVQTDGAIGWATVQDNQGHQFLEAA